MAEVPTQPQPQVTPQKTSWKKIGLTILIILVVTGLIAGIYWFFILEKESNSDLTGPVPTPKITTATPSATPSDEKDETADWKIYKNQEHNFQIKIPKSWNLTDKNCDGSKRNNVVVNRNPLDPCKGLIQVPGAGELAIYVGGEFESIEVLPECKETQENVEIAGVKAVKYYGPEEPCVYPSFGTTKIFFNYKEKGYQIEHLNTDLVGNYDAIYDQIISTFKFLN